MGFLKPKAPKYPDPIDPGKSALDYIRAMSDPRLQDKILAAERRGRSQYLELGLQDIQGMLEGYGGQEGTVSILQRITPQLGDIQARATSQQREADVADVERLGSRATEALRAADPEMQNLIGQQGELTSRLYGMADRVTPQQQRMAEQQARAAGTARGRGFGQGTIAAEILGREEVMANRRMEAQQSGSQLFQMLRQTSADPFQAILGRPSQTLGMAQNQQGFGAQSAQAFQGPQLFNPDVGVNMAMQNQANQANYNANIYGAQAGMYGQTMGGLMQMGGMLGAAAIMGCWVARACYGVHDDRWMLFRLWLFSFAPKWFANLYIKHGSAFADWVDDKPVIKWAIRKWMNTRIKRLNMEVAHG